MNKLYSHKPNTYSYREVNSYMHILSFVHMWEITLTLTRSWNFGINNLYSVDRYGISVSQMTADMFHLSLTLPGPFLIHDLSAGL
jgi:hypothetical protein